MTERGGDEKVGTCPTCGQTFPTQEELTKHLLAAHEGVGLLAPDPRDGDERDPSEG
jgi:uncharacterized C2H2 Zn-finger protein